jgi:hypothetical protein
MVAAISASTGSHVNAAAAYGGAIPLYNVTSGSNGHPCQKGYNLCTGLGSWNKAESTGGSITAAEALSITSSPQSVMAGKTSASITLALNNPAGNGGLSVALTTSSSAGRFATSAHTKTGNSLSVLVPAGQSSATFTYEDTKAGDPMLTAAASGWTTANQSETIMAGTVATVTVTPATISLAPSATQSFAGTAVDAYGNPVSISPTWTTTVSGAKLSATTGTSTTFTAGTSAATGKVTATASGIKGTAAVTVTAPPPSAVGVTVKVGNPAKSGTSYRVPVTVTTTGTAGNLAGAAVTMRIYSGSCTGKLVGTASATTSTAGTTSFTLTTPSTGTYCAMATATHSGYSQGSQTKSFTISNGLVSILGLR